MRARRGSTARLDPSTAQHVQSRSTRQRLGRRVVPLVAPQSPAGERPSTRVCCCTLCGCVCACSVKLHVRVVLQILRCWNDVRCGLAVPRRTVLVGCKRVGVCFLPARIHGATTWPRGVYGVSAGAVRGVTGRCRVCSVPARNLRQHDVADFRQLLWRVCCCAWQLLWRWCGLVDRRAVSCRAVQ